MAAESGQLALQGGASLTSLFWASLLTVACGTALSLLLPPEAGGRAGLSSLPRALEGLWAELLRCYASPQLRLLSCWWALGSVASTFTENYGTNLFDAIDSTMDANGHVTFVTRALCCLAALAAIRLEAHAAALGAGVYAAGIALAGCSIAGLATAPTLLNAYCSYAATLTVLQFCTCLLYAQCAHALDDAACEEAGAEEGEAVQRVAPRGRFAVLFGANATAALALQTLVQAIASATRAPARRQFGGLAGCVTARARVRACSVVLTRRALRVAATPSPSRRSPQERARCCVHAAAPGVWCNCLRPVSLRSRGGGPSWRGCLRQKRGTARRRTNNLSAPCAQNGSKEPTSTFLVVVTRNTCAPPTRSLQRRLQFVEGGNVRGLRRQWRARECCARPRTALLSRAWMYAFSPSCTRKSSMMASKLGTLESWMMQVICNILIP